MTSKKFQKLGTVLEFKNKEGETVRSIKLGQENSNDPKYDYTVQIRVLKGSPKTKEEIKNAEVLAMVTNPWVNLQSPHPKAPKSILNELLLTLQTES